MSRLTNTPLKKLGLLVLAGVVLFGLIQLIPVPKTNPKVVAEPNWAAAPAGTRDLAVRACYDCHSNTTTWPWYSKVAPVSWLVYRDVQGGRDRLNFSDWNNSHFERGDVGEVVRGGEMPPWFYIIMHPNAKLSDTEKQQLANGLEIIMGQSPSGGSNTESGG